MKVYLLRMESYQDYLEQESISYAVGVFSSKKEAEDYSVKWKESTSNYDFYEVVNEFELDKP